MSLKKSSHSVFCSECRNILVPRGRHAEFSVNYSECSQGHKLFLLDKLAKLEKVGLTDNLEEIIKRKSTELSTFDCGACGGRYADFMSLNKDAGTALYLCRNVDCKAIYRASLK